MKLVVSFYGMCLCVLDKRKGNRAAGATVILLNGAAPPRAGRTAGRPRLPYHHPMLFVPARHADVKRTAWSPVPAPEAIVDTEGLMSGRHVAWSLSGLDLTLGRGKGLSMYENQEADASGRLPDPASVDDAKAFLDWRRIPDLARIAPGAKVRPAFTAIGRNALGLIRFTGGELRGARPKSISGCATPWRFSDTFEQIITDRFEMHCELPGTELKASGFASGRSQRIRLTAVTDKVVHLVVVHEASPLVEALRVTKAVADPVLPHYTAFYDAVRGKTVDALNAPRPAGSAIGGRRPSIHTPFCPPALI